MNALKQARENVGLKQIEVCQTINVVQTQLSQYESGKKNPSLNVLIAMQRLYECSLDYLVFGKEFEKRA